MKTKWLIVCWLCLLVCNLHAQTILIANSLTKVPNSSAIVQYNNLFGQWNMPEKDDG